MNYTLNIQVGGEIRFPDIALLAQAMMGKAQPAAAPAPTQIPTPPPAIPQPSVTPTPAPIAPVPQVSPAVPQTVPPTVSSAQQTAPSPNVVPGTEAPKYSIDDIARAGAELAQQGAAKIEELSGLLQQFGLQAVTQLRPDQMGPFVMALRGMGARI